MEVWELPLFASWEIWKAWNGVLFENKVLEYGSTGMQSGELPLFANWEIWKARNGLLFEDCCLVAPLVASCGFSEKKNKQTLKDFLSFS